MRLLHFAAIAAAIALSSSAIADSKDAYFSARYGGWSKEVGCWKYGRHRNCQVLTIGRGRAAGGVSEWAHLAYTCQKGTKQEWLDFNFVSTKSVDSGVSTFEVQWDNGPRETVGVELTMLESKGKPLYLFDIEPPFDFARKMPEHDTLYAWIPYWQHERPEKTKFSLKNAVRAIKSAVQECGIEFHVSRIARFFDL